MGFLNSALVSLTRLAYTLVGIPYASIYTRIPFESLDSICAANITRTQLDENLCMRVGMGQSEEWMGWNMNYFDVSSALCSSSGGWSRGGNNFSAPVNEAYFANGTVWKSVLIKGPWQSVEKSLDCLMGNNQAMSIIEYVTLCFCKRGNT
jgi:hypothetical protein